MSIRLKHLAALIVEPAAPGRPLVALERLDSWTGKLLPSAQLTNADANTPGVSAVESGDVLFGKLRPYLAKGWIVDRPAVASTELLCLRPGPLLDTRWLGYITMSEPFVRFAVSTSEGSKMPRTSWEKLSQFRPRLPPLAEQRTIADYLDTETTRIDALITKKRRLITLLEERYQAYVDHLLWRGDTIKLKHVASLLPGYAFSSSDFGPGLGGAKLLRGANVGVGEVDWADSVSLATQGTELARYQVRTGDVILGMDRPFIKAGTRAFVAGPDAEGALLVQRVCRIRPMTVDAAVPIADAIRSPRFAAYIESDLTGVSVPHLSDEQIGEFRVPTISASGNDHLVGHLESAGARARARSNRLLAQVDLLVERRQALITAAVTGELAIPGAK